MTDTNNNSGWVTASGAFANAGSNIANASIANTPDTVVGNGGLEITGTGPVTSNRSACYTIGQEAITGGSVMATVKAPHGGPIGDRNPNGSDLVSIAGMNTTIAAAVNAGLLVRNQDGSYSDPAAPVALKDPTTDAKAIAKQADDPETPKAEPSGVSFGEDADATMQEFLKGQNPGDLFKMVDSILHRGDMDEGTIGRMARMAGVEPAEMREKVGGVWQGAYDSGWDVMAEAGLDNEDALAAFIADNPQLGSSMIEAARNFFVYHKAEGLRNMGETYLPQMDRYETERAKEMLTEAGWDYVEKPGGGLQVMVNGTPVSWEVAVKQRIITFSQVEA